MADWPGPPASPTTASGLGVAPASRRRTARVICAPDGSVGSSGTASFPQSRLGSPGQGANGSVAAEAEAANARPTSSASRGAAQAVVSAPLLTDRTVAHRRSVHGAAGIVPSVHTPRRRPDVHAP